MSIRFFFETYRGSKQTPVSSPLLSLTMPERRSSARRRMDSSLSSRHCRIRSLCACTLFGCVCKIFDMASRPRYFTRRKANVLLSHASDMPSLTVLIGIFDENAKFLHTQLNRGVTIWQARRNGHKNYKSGHASTHPHVKSLPAMMVLMHSYSSDMADVL